MAAYKAPDFAERSALAVQARQKALDQLRAKPAPDENVVAARKAAQESRDLADAEKRRLAKAARDEAKALKTAQAAQAAAEAEAEAAAAIRSPAELKAARDARYEARKQRKG